MLRLVIVLAVGLALASAHQQPRYTRRPTTTRSPPQRPTCQIDDAFISNAERLFNTLDTDGDGLQDPNPSNRRQSLDPNGDGQVEVEEYVGRLRNRTNPITYLIALAMFHILAEPDNCIPMNDFANRHARSYPDTDGDGEAEPVTRQMFVNDKIKILLGFLNGTLRIPNLECRLVTGPCRP